MGSDSSAAIGFSVHTGWAGLVAIAGPLVAPQVIDRRRVELLDGPDADQRRFVFHAASELALQSARQLVDRTTTAVRKATLKGLRAALAELSESGVRPALAGILAGGKPPTGTLAAILASHAAIHAAEGELYRQAIVLACQECGLAARLVPARDAANQLAEVAGLSPGKIESHLAGLRAVVGAPWGQDQKLAMLAAWCALADGGPPKAPAAATRRRKS